jgi:iron complex outermembrane receptor protein
MMFLFKPIDVCIRKLKRTSWLIGVLFIFSISFSNILFAQNGIINGLVKDQDTVLQAATVSIANKTIVANGLGEFSIALRPGTYIIVITHAGYKKIEELITISAGENKSHQFHMTREEELSEVKILGSRSTVQRSNLNTPVPVDRINSKELLQTGQPSLIQMLNFTAPSFSSSRQSLTDPVTLRGLSPDHLLILLNGTRYHNLAGINSGSIRGTLGRGSAANDLNSIPFSSIEKIEILRDGASAQYGSDAIAGVMNVILKETTGKANINLHLGQQYKGDGESILFGMNHGISLGKKKLPGGRQPFLNFSGDFRYRNGTHRGGEYQGTVYYNNVVLDNQRILEKGFNRKTPVSNDGSVELSSYGFLVNGGYPINKKTEIFWTGTVSYRHPVSPGLYRFPKNTNQVNIALYPDGFKPTNIINTWDISAIAGAKGKTNKDWSWEWNSVWGKNTGIFNWKNTNNASQFALRANAPTEFYGGKSAFIQQANILSFAKDLSKKINGVKTFNLAFGGELRFEKFVTKQGEEAAWKNYDTTGRTQGGAQPSPGITPDDVVNESRKVAGLYIDLETDVNDHLLINIAGRYESYEDFNDNLAGKLAMRYKFSPAFSIRGSISNGYHAPALQQAYYSATLSGFKNIGGVNVPVRLGIFNNNSPVSKAFGVKPLQPEKAINFGIGFTSTISPHINLSVDGYWIQIKDRLALSGIFDRNNSQVDSLLKNYTDIDQVQFMTNAIDTKTLGIDIVMNGNWNIDKAILEFTLAANFTKTNVFGPVQTTDKLTSDSSTNTLFNREEREKIEHGQPGSKIIFSVNYRKGKLGFLIRSTRFGKTSAVYDSADKLRDEFFSAKTLTDVSINYSPKSWLTLTAGANNIFDIYPDPLRNPLNKQQGILIYSNEGMPFGYNGGYYYLNMKFSF